METRSEYERVLRRQLGRLARKLRRRQEHIGRGFSAAQIRWLDTQGVSVEEAKALAALTPSEAFVCGATMVYEAVLDEIIAAANIARLASRIQEPDEDRP